MSEIAGELARVTSAFAQPTLTLLHQRQAPVVITIFRAAFGRDNRPIPTARLHTQVEEHLAGHMDRLPADDKRSRAIVDQMKEDEVRHAEEAMRLGGAELPFPVRAAMRLAAKVMTGAAHYI